MFTSDIDRQRKGMTKIGFIYLFVSLFCVLFGAVYEWFSHEVYSYFMLYAFVFPLVGGVVPFFGLAFCRAFIPGRITCNLYHSAIATLTIGSLFQGVLEIYGTTNRLVSVYWILGVLLLLPAIVTYVYTYITANNGK